MAQVPWWKNLMWNPPIGTFQFQMSPCSEKSVKNGSVPWRLPHPYRSGKGTPLRSSGIAGLPLPARNVPGPLVLLAHAQPLSRSILTDSLRQIFSTAGTEGNFSSHSFRIGAATLAARNGIPDHLIQALGRSTSNAYQLYIRTPSEALAGISSQLAWYRVPLPFVIHSSFDIAVKLLIELPWACTVVFGVALNVSCFPLVSVLSVFLCNCCSLVLGVVRWPLLFQAPRRYLLLKLEHYPAPPTW